MNAVVMNLGQPSENTGAQEMELNEKFFNTRFASFSVRMPPVALVRILEYATVKTKDVSFTDNSRQGRPGFWVRAYRPFTTV